MRFSEVEVNFYCYYSDVVSSCLATKRCDLGIDTEDVLQLSGGDFDNLDPKKCEI